MTSNRFTDLAIGACKSLGIHPPPPDALRADGTALEMAIDDVSVTLAYEPRRDPSQLFIFCRLGRVPADREAAILRRLLEANYARVLGTVILSVDPATGEAILEYSADMSQVTAESLAAGVTAAVETARLWRDSYFVHDILPATNHAAVASADFA